MLQYAATAAAWCWSTEKATSTNTESKVVQVCQVWAIGSLLVKSYHENIRFSLISPSYRKDENDNIPTLALCSWILLMNRLQRLVLRLNIFSTRPQATKKCRIFYNETLILKWSNNVFQVTTRLQLKISKRRKWQNYGAEESSDFLVKTDRNDIRFFSNNRNWRLSMNVNHSYDRFYWTYGRILSLHWT